MKLPIADCRLPIVALSARCSFSRSRHDGGQVVGFLQERGQFAFGNNSCLGKQLKPQRGFARFFFNGSHLGGKFCFASSATPGAVIRRHRGAAANDLFGNNTSRIVALRNGSRELDNAERKSFRALFEFGRIHVPTLRNQSAIL
jgi:hypothetical protein